MLQWRPRLVALAVALVLLAIALAAGLEEQTLLNLYW
jgi:hypothetical protein